MWTSGVALILAANLSLVGTGSHVGPSDPEPPAQPSSGLVPAPVPNEAEPAEAEPPAEEDAGPTSLEDALLEEAEQRYVDGNELFRRRQYLKAAAAFERSYAAAPTGKSLHAMALSFEKGGNTVRALEGYLRYLELPDCSEDELHCAELRGEVIETVERLRGKVGVLAITIEDGVDIRGIEIDDNIIPPEDFPLVLEPGRFEIRVRGRRRGEVRVRPVEIEPGQRTSLFIEGFNKPPPPTLDDSTPTEPRPTTAPPAGRLSQEERTRRLKIAFYGGVGLTVLSGAAVAVTGGLTQQAYNRQNERCRGEGVDCSGTEYPAEDRERVEQLRPVTNALVGVTAGLGLVTVVVGLFAFSGRSGAGARASVTRVTPGPGGLRLRF